MGLFKGLKINKVFDSVSGGIDKLKFTKQEQAEFNMKMSDKLAEYTANSLSENSVRSKARRTIAYIVVANFFGMVWFYVATLWLKPELSDKVYNSIIDFKIATAFLVVLGFFFTTYLLRGTPLKKH